MKKLTMILIVGLLFIGCTDEPKKSDETNNLSSIAKRINTPFREMGYSQHASKIIVSQAKLDSFLTHIGNESNWNKKTEFLETLQDTPIDFKKYNLLMYRITEGSGSVKLSIDTPTLSSSSKDMIVNIKRDVPSAGTADMAYYALFYKVAKSVERITFKDGTQDVIIANKASDVVLPLNCTAWHDGCNECSIMGGGETSCTERYCIVYRPEDFRCKAWKK